jgi:endonuclease/exonuclease/phosphatase family metal-dependent hydrolase
MMGSGVWRGVVVMFTLMSMQPAAAEMSLKILTLNLWGGGLHAGRSIEDSVGALRAADADVIALQEVWWPDGGACAQGACAPARQSLACVIARELRLHCHEQRGPQVRGSMAVLSRYPVMTATASGFGVQLDVHGRPLTLFNLHLPDAPYQPYQLKRIAYDDSPWLDTAQEAVAAADAVRGPIVDVLEREVARLGDERIVIAGDFNEPSHRDWTPRASALGLHPIAVKWPTTQRLEAMGFVDAWRVVHRDEIAKPGHTWTARPAPADHHDRIDFVFARGPALIVLEVKVIGEPGPGSDIAVPNWPSDHRGVLATLRFGESALVVRRSDATMAR